MKVIILLILATLLWCTFNLPITLNDQAMNYIKKAINRNVKISTKVMKLDRSNNIYNRALTAFEAEDIDKITIDFVVEKTTLYDLLGNKRRFDLILNENRHAEYFLTIIVDDNFNYIISNLTLRIM